MKSKSVRRAGLRAISAGALVALVPLAAALPLHAKEKQSVDPAARAAATEAQMTDDERITLTLGLLTSPRGDQPAPEGSHPGAGFIPGIARLGVPALHETDASLGVTWISGARGNGGTQLPSGTAQGATWNVGLIEQGGRMIGSEARAKGFNVMLAGGINLMRDPRNGRTFEYLGEDPLHAGLLGGAAVRGIQSNHVISTVKHFAINPQETGRAFMNTVIEEKALRESDLLAFEIALEQGDPGAIMCAYNATNGAQSCGNKWLLTDVLRKDWDYRGFVMSDWGAVDGLDYALAGLDQQSGSPIDPQPFFGDQLKAAAQSDPAYRKRLGEMTRAILHAIYDNGLDAHPSGFGTVDAAANSEVALKVAQEGIVLLTNPAGLLPLGPDVRSIAVIGGHADAGTPVGGGSSKVLGDDGPSVSVPGVQDGNGPFAAMLNQDFNRSAPLAAIRAIAPKATIKFRDGTYPAEAALAAAQADVTIIFATQYQTEGFDVPELSLPNGQDALIAAVAKANPNTIVVLETGGPVAMPWKDDVKAVVEAWYPGARGGEAIADVLFGKVNPSGRLPLTFPASVAQLPRPALPGLGEVEPNFVGVGAPGQKLDVDYNIEGADIGYRWFAREGQAPLFAMGHGLSYTTFASEGFSVASGKDGLIARATIRNTGARSGAEVAQVYLADAHGTKLRRLAGFTKLELAPGEAREVSIPLEPRVLADWTADGWQVAAGTYRFVLAKDALADGPVAEVKLPERRIAP
ncbi:glycoside hydrolase family 3 C-terminal domain-containing protein [Erythrobacter sp. SG61-1L]|uniref:beta-glucosidase family protein n=1 Tax=Erythrobacter sp. SG61-1L TaxID=1603897 RepID=UPI00187280F0|nr:glycoside hydrolase family 3 C-terminal domain-containing protein [Erythrobacter sp. SG61-1L]